MALEILTWGEVGAVVLAVAGCVEAVRGLFREVQRLRRASSGREQAWILAEGLRSSLVGLAVSGAAAAWLAGIPWLMGFCIAVAVEEYLEITTVLSALRSAPRRRPGSRRQHVHPGFRLRDVR